MKFEFFEKIAFKFVVLFFMELEYYRKLEFSKLEFSINGKSLHISVIVVDCKIFSNIVIFGHFNPFF